MLVYIKPLKVKFQELYILAKYFITKPYYTMIFYYICPVI